MTEAAVAERDVIDINPTREVALAQPGEGYAITPLAMIDRALVTGAATETLERLFALQERWEAAQARKAFDAAVASAKAEIKPVVRNAAGHNNKRYADFAAISAAVDPILAKHGLSYRFRTEQSGNVISVTCILAHRDGHQDTTTLSGPSDSTGNKNAIQAIGSTLTYLQRYSLVQMLGLAAATDDDGAASPGSAEPISNEQIARLNKLIAETHADFRRFCAHMKVESLAEIKAKDFQRAVAALEQKRNREPAQ